MFNPRTLNSTLDRMITLNRAIDQAFNTGNWSAQGRVWVPAIDLVERKDAYVVYTELPGVDGSQVDVNFEKNVLTIKGTKAPTTEANEGEVRVFAAERITGAFERTIRLPEYVDGEHISASFVNGLLTVTVPKAQAAQARKIEISAAQ